MTAVNNISKYLCLISYNNKNNDGYMDKDDKNGLKKFSNFYPK